MRSTPLELAISHDRRAPVLRLSGDIDLATCPTVEAALAVRLRRAPALLVVDLGAVGFIGSCGLELLAETRRTALGSVRVAACVPAVLRAMEVTGTIEAIAPYRTVADALTVDA
ncbi:STAS domain-containing protein [Actinokineospora auranticolor]|uniref:Anti-anti-sigma factor n=1 Tax=Actinokineospora auranticolor TaxID=155976 RepID=A0A2S6GM60_9PSEU|nr:STAS domain-containing protein [Actinokineospora auranticolor]PPK66324.1 anti-anti-sigma factor [Actinokineospora auranticolor]